MYLCFCLVLYDADSTFDESFRKPKCYKAIVDIIILLLLLIILLPYQVQQQLYVLSNTLKYYLATLNLFLKSFLTFCGFTIHYSPELLNHSRNL